MRSAAMSRNELRRPVGRYRATLAALIAVAALVVLGAIALHRLSSPSGRVAIVGDSITVVAGHDITVALSGSDKTDVKAKWGQRIDQMLPALSGLLPHHPTAVVVNLGSNDAIQAKTHPNWRQGFDRMVAMLAPSHCVLLTTISTLLDGPPPVPPVAAEINDAIATLTVARPNFHVVDWNKAVHGPNGSSLLSSDRVHPSPAGQITLAALVRNALQRDCHIPA